MMCGTAMICAFYLSVAESYKAAQDEFHYYFMTAERGFICPGTKDESLLVLCFDFL